ncbi:hypothetical protein U1Q18_039784 [Sarracenia purpurea var. burkii]
MSVGLVDCCEATLRSRKIGRVCSEGTVVTELYLSRDSKGKGRNLGKEQEGENLGDSRGDNGEESQIQGDGPLHITRKEPKIALGQIVGSRVEPMEKSVTKGPDPVDENYTWTPVLPNRVSGNYPTTRAPNWKR